MKQANGDTSDGLSLNECVLKVEWLSLWVILRAISWLLFPQLFSFLLWTIETNRHYIANIKRSFRRLLGIFSRCFEDVLNISYLQRLKTSSPRCLQTSAKPSTRPRELQIRCV